MRLLKTILLTPFFAAVFAFPTTAAEKTRPVLGQTDIMSAYGTTDDRITDQVMHVVGDTAELPFILFEDVKFDFKAICPATCKFNFTSKDGKLVLKSIELAPSDVYHAYIAFGHIEDGDTTAFNVKLRAALIANPRELVPGTGS